MSWQIILIKQKSELLRDSKDNVTHQNKMFSNLACLYQIMEEFLRPSDNPTEKMSDGD